MTRDGYPSLFQINTRVWLTELSRVIGRPATLNDIPDVELDRVAEMGFDWVWLLSVWQTGEAGRRISRSNPEWRREFQETLPDLREEDIPGSGFAITGYTVTSSPTTRAWITRGSRVIPSTTSPGPNGTRPERRRIMSGSSASAATCCWPTAAIRTLPVGPTPCSSTTATRRFRTR